MKLIKLSLKNFKGIKSLTIDTQGGNVDVYGDNATGKTTIFDAFLWLLFGKDSQNKKDFSIKTLTPEGKAITGLDHEVEGIFEINGRQLTLKKSFKEKWTKKRGSATTEFTGHTTDHYVDGVPVSEKDYVAKIAEIIDEGVFKLLTSPSYFNEQLHWQDRRKILLEVCGDISDADVIDRFATLNNKDQTIILTNIINQRTLDDHRKIIAARRSEINKELDKIPVRIDEVQQSLPEVELVEDEIKTKIATLQDRLNQKNAEVSRIQNGGEVAEVKKAIAEAEARILQIKNRLQLDSGTMVQTKKATLLDMNMELNRLEHELQSLELQRGSAARKISELDALASSLRDEWHTENCREFLFSQETVCPACGQDLPKERLAGAQEKAQNAFNLEKAERLSKITERGKQAKTEVEKLKEEISGLDLKICDLIIHITANRDTAEAVKEEIEQLLSAVPDVSKDPEYQAAAKEKEALEHKLGVLSDDIAGQVASLLAEINLLNSELTSLNTQLAQSNKYHQGVERIKELQAREKELAAEFERLEGETFLTEEFIRAKVSLLEEKINSRFKLARFKLFDVQVNGAVAECCETTYNGVPYSSMNNAARINIGLDIINTLSEHYGFEAPIFIDNREAVTEVIETRGQLISLIVSAADKKLSIEQENKVIKEAV